ncbi:MAG: hypothetical protein IJ087_00430 [Eggerthellaceae bacterium]|nr:hypothetical protein [Eggerthellaceae bacterium]
MALDWAAGYEAQWRIARVDRSTWADAGDVRGVLAASVERSCTGLLESGMLRVEGDGLPDGYYRVHLHASQGPERAHVAFATLLCEAEAREADRGTSETDVAGSSVLAPAQGQRLLAGEYAPKGCDGAAWAASLLKRAVHAPIRLLGGFALGSHVVFEAGTTLLDAAWTVLDAGGFCMQIDGTGTVHVGPLPVAPSLVLDRNGARCLTPGVTRSSDRLDVPNRYTAVLGADVAQAVNDDPASPTSAPARGRFVDVVDPSPVLVGGETLAAYASRKLEEASVVSVELTYRREFQPGVLPFSVVRGSLPALGIEGDMRVSAQSIECAHGAVVTEKAVREERTWRR